MQTIWNLFEVFTDLSTCSGLFRLSYNMYFLQQSSWFHWHAHCLLNNLITIQHKASAGRVQASGVTFLIC